MKNILIVDDSATMRRMVRASLKSFLKDLAFDEAGNGLEAIEQLALKSINLMVLDLNMPDMHGMEVLQFVRSHQKYKTLPIIVLTTKHDNISRASTINAGASAYITKPFKPDILADQVYQLLRGGK
ncbi:Two-component system response regulator [Candidatus Magnetomoraceae bacterium gMMP-15]